MENVAIRGRRGAAVPGLSRSDPPRGPRFNQGANSFQIIPNKTKQISLDLFVRIGTFQRVTGKKIKKNNSRLKLCAKRLKPLSFPFSTGGQRPGEAWVRSATEFVIPRILADDSVFLQENVAYS
jgi:hypothetical protein